MALTLIEYGLKVQSDRSEHTVCTKAGYLHFSRFTTE
jgi:hypothetical protein